jgi:RNA polymerase sigma factor FliA
MQSYTYAVDESKREKLIEKFLPLVARIAGRLAMGLPDHVDKDDLISSGTMGLMDAIEKYNPSKGPFQTYVPLRIKGAMLDELRKMSWLPRSVIAKSREFEKAQAVLTQNLGRSPTEDEMANHLEISKKELNLLMAQINTRSLVHLESYLFSSSEGEKRLEDYLPETRDWADPEEILLKNERTAELAEAIKRLNEREQLVLSLYYHEELTLREIGDVLSVSESRVSQIHARIMVKLRQNMGGD